VTREAHLRGIGMGAVVVPLPMLICDRALAAAKCDDLAFASVSQRRRHDAPHEV